MKHSVISSVVRCVPSWRRTQRKLALIKILVGCLHPSRSRHTFMPHRYPSNSSCCIVRRCRTCAARNPALYHANRVRCILHHVNVRTAPSDSWRTPELFRGHRTPSTSRRLSVEDRLNADDAASGTAPHCSPVVHGSAAAYLVRPFSCRTVSAQGYKAIGPASTSSWLRSQGVPHRCHVDRACS